MAKDILKNSFYYTILGFLPFSFAIVFTPIYLKYLNESEYGILNLFILYTGLMAKIFGIGLPNAFGIFYWDVYKSKQKLKELISSVLGLLLFFQLIFIAIGLVFGETITSFIVKSSDQFTYNPIFITALFFSAFMVYYEMFLYFFRNEAELKLYSILSVSTLVLLTIGTLIAVVYLDLKAVGAILGRTFGYGVIVSGFLFYFIFKYGISFRLKQSKALFAFSIPLFVNGIIGAFGYGVDRIIIERLDTLESLGIYGLALVIITVIETWFTALNNALSPTLFKLMKESLFEKAKEIKVISQAIILLVTLVIAIIVALIYPVFELMIPPNFHLAALYVPILAFSFIWRVFTSLYTYPLYIKKKTKYLLFNQSINLILTIVIGYIAYQYFGIIGIVLTVYVVKMVEFLVMYNISKRMMHLPLDLTKFIFLAITMGIVATVITYLNHCGINRYILYLIPLVSLITFTSLFLSKEFKLLIHSFKHRKELF